MSESKPKTSTWELLICSDSVAHALGGESAQLQFLISESLPPGTMVHLLEQRTASSWDVTLTRICINLDAREPFMQKRTSYLLLPSMVSALRDPRSIVPTVLA
jgi:hypothetical protein